MKYLVRALCAISLIVLPASLLAQPANDNFANAWTLTGASVVTNGNSGQNNQGIPNATKENGEPNHAGRPGGRSVWFGWTAPISGQTRIDTVGSQFNTLLAVYTGTAVNALTLVAENDNVDGLGGLSRLEFAAVAGTTYRIAVDGRSNFGGGNNPASGPYTLRLTVLASVVMTSPTNGEVFTSGTPIPLAVTAVVPTPPVTRVDFYRNGLLLSSDPTSPYEASAENSPVGTNRFYGVAVDSGGINWTSAVVSVGVFNFGVNIVQPSDGTMFLNANPITVSVVGLLASGSITNVEFFADGQKFAEDSAAPFSGTWNAVTSGSHRLTATGRDNSGNTYQSAPVNIGVAQTLVPLNSVWKYLDNGSDQGTAWVAPGFDDTGWSSGPGELGYGDGDEMTVVGFGPDSNNRYLTTYFRRAFVVSNATAISSLLVALERDDGAVVHLNGQELFRSPNMPAAPAAITYTTVTTDQNGIEDTVDSFVRAGTLLVEGTNLLAVEIHQQSGSSSDISFDLSLIGLPTIVRNQTPTITLDSPTNNASLFAPIDVTLTATASDADGTVAKVEFFDLNTKLGEDTTEPYEFLWNAPALGWHVFYAVATDEQGAAGYSDGAFVSLYDAVGTPLVQIISPTNHSVFDGPTNLVLAAGTTSPVGATNVQFLANGTNLGRVSFLNPTSPVLALLTWSNAAFGTNILTAISTDASGASGASTQITVVVTAPPPNLFRPTIAAVNPLRDTAIGGLTNIQITFSERVVGVDASDLLVNDVAAVAVVGSGSNYTFTVRPPPAGTVTITWADPPGIVDLGFPPLTFDERQPDATWTYTLTDLTPPTILARNPAAGATLTNLTQIAVTFSELVTGLDAADLLVNGAPALGLSGGGTAYTFSFSPPLPGTVNLTWASGHGIADLATPPNSFNGAGAGWSYTLDNRTVLVQSNSTWLFIKARAEASTPIDAWRQIAFDDSSWSNAPAPFFYGDPYSNGVPAFTLLSDMLGSYSSIYLRKNFVLANAAAATNLFLNHQSDDGFITWINGVEVLRYNMGTGDIPYNGSAPTAIQESGGGGGGAPYINVTLPNPAAYLVDGANVLAIHAFNNQPQTSSDFGFNAQIYTYLADPSLVPPRIASVTPPAGDVFFLTNITVRFTEPVTSVNAGDLRINGVAATALSSTTNTTYTFHFAQPLFGNVAVTWTAGHEIQDLDEPPKPFDGTAATFQYTLLNPSTPVITAQIPTAGATLSNLTQITVAFSKAVRGVEPEHLLVNGVPAAGLTGGPATFTFFFAQPAYGPVSVGWASGHSIEDLENPPNVFDATRPGSTWTYTLVDLIPPVVASKNPPAGSTVTNLTAITVTFSKPVAGVNATDLLINGTPAAGVTGANPTYTFTFPPPNATVVNVTWSPAHGIRDLATVPNAFDGNGPGARWTYATPDTVAPTVASIDPPPFVTVRSLTQIRVTFTEPVTGVDTNDLLINNVKARQVTGSGAGPYTFTYLPPSTGLVDVRWTSTNGITDLALPTPNPFSGGEWTYTYDPTATFAGKVNFSEIMFDPAGGAQSNEWLELRNVSPSLVNLTGWRFTRGLDFTFPNVFVPAGGYLVVAANLAAFQSRYPGVANVIGGWNGGLANSGETLELQTSLGESVNSVRYASEGDWAQRIRGNGADRVTSITRNGTTATVTIFQHNHSGNDQVVISGADQPEYNGRFTVSGTTPTTFNITVNGSPASPATGNIVSRWVLDDNNAGWSWYSPAGGFGYSLELLNPALPNASGQNWQPSVVSGGTPGAANSIATNNLAPLISSVTHSPAVPRSSDSVAITARVRDELSNGVASVTLFFRNHTAASPGPFNSTPMLDNGNSGDGLQNDGLYGAILTPNAAGTIIEFYVQAADTSGRSRTWPAPALDTDGPGGTFGAPGQFANALFQVDNESITNSMGSIRIILTGTERASFPPGNRNSDASPNCTLISSDGDGTKIRYLCDVRVRGEVARRRTPPNNRINIPGDDTWNGLAAINLNSQYVHAQLLGNTLALKAGVPTEVARVIQYRINGVNPARIDPPPGGNSGDGWGVFLLLTPPNGDLAEAIYPQDGDGNFYRASTGNHNADLSYQNGIPASYLTRGYYKTSNRSENDWSDFAALTFAFDQVADDASYVQAVSTNANVPAWMRYFALGSLINFGETSLFNGRGDDYALYRGLNNRRFVLLGHDFDTIFGQGDTGPNYYPINTNSSLVLNINPPNANANVNNLRRFMNHPAFAPIYYAEIKTLADTTFHPTNFNPLVDQLLGNWNGPSPDANVIASIKQWANNRRSVILAQIPLSLTVTGPSSTTSASVALNGTAHAIDTRKVLVNGALANWTALGATWTANPALQPGLNRVVVQSLDSNDVEFARATLDITYDDGSVTTVSGAVASDAIWSAAAGPYQVTANLTVNNGVTLTLQPGTTVYLNPGVNLTVANGGRLLAEGTDSARIRFANAPGSGNWGGLTINGSAGSPETRITYAHFEGNNGTAIDVNAGDLFLSHCSFGNTAVRYLDLDASSFVVQDSHFPAATAAFEPIHGSSGIKAGGRGLFARNFVGRARGYNDSIDFTGGNRPGPILQIINNVFTGSDDDLLDLDSTDAWIEGNIFLHTHRNGSPDSASAISGGADNADTSQITAVGNLFFDVDHAANAKQGNFYTLLNNTIVHQTKVGSQDTNTAVVILADDTTPQGLGMYLEGNIILDAENLTRNVTTAQVTYTNNLIHQLTGAPWSGPGGGNVNADPLLKRIPAFAETTNFASWAEAQVMWDHFSLRPGSPASRTGPGGRDKGAVAGVRGASVSGEPVGTTPLTTATLQVGPLRTGFGIPPAGFPNGSGITHYRWRLDGGSWSAETPAAAPITLNNLPNGPHYVEVSGRNDAGFYQDDPVFGADATITVSRTWTVNTASSPLRLSELLASNVGTSNHFGATPDLLELVNASPTPLDLSGVGLTDDPANPAKFLFPLNTTLAAGAYLTVFADNANNAGFHLGFNLPQFGGTLYLYDSALNGGALIDSVTYGLQLTDRSIGRLAEGSWALCLPSFSGPNRAAPTGDSARLRINEWLALAQAPFASDFIELLNTDSLPVALGGLFITDQPLGWPTRHQFTPLSFVAGNAYLRLLADGSPGAGADHLNFSLDGDEGQIALVLPELVTVDCVVYQAQMPNVSQGRSPNGSQTISSFTTPTPGAPNPLLTGPAPNGGQLVINEILAVNGSRAELDGRTPDWVELYNGTTTNVNLGDYSLTDNTLSSRKYIFPANTMLAPGAYLRVICDPGATNPGPNTATNFALSGSGGGVYLFDALLYGGNLINSVLYGIQARDFSLGRVPDGSTNWILTSVTPGTANVPIPTLGDASSLRINEWMADAGPDEDDWFEVYNPNPLPVALGGLYLSDSLSSRLQHKIAALSFLGSGSNAYQRFIADSSQGGDADHVNFSLRALGEAIGISTTNGTLINGVVFFNQVEDRSEGRFPDGGTDIVSFPGTASPGESNYRLHTQVVINEVVTRTELPLEDAIELRNLTAQPLDVSGWWLSDDNGTLQKYQIPSPTVLPPNGFTVIYETHFTNRNETAIPFALSSKGDEVVLSATTANGALTGYRAKAKFGAADAGVSFGRYVTSDGRDEFVAMNARTFGADDPGTVEQFRDGPGATNAYPAVGPVVISEIMYHPPDVGTNDNVLEEFIELHNITTVPVPLYDPAAPTNTWHLRDAVDFDFPADLTLSPGTRLLVVSFDPINNLAALAAFLARYNLAEGTPIVGPYDGKLANNNDDIELRKPGPPDAEGVPYILVERVRYSDTAPWPVLADGTGYSLQRLANNEFGNDPVNWTAATPTPGPLASMSDSDHDGLPDAWEIAHGFDPFNPLDASLDSDGDGLTNLQEYQVGTDPRDAASGVRFSSVALSANGTSIVLTFTALANLSYTVEYTEALGSGVWHPIEDLAAAPTNRVIQIAAATTGSARFYRLRTPWRFGAGGVLRINEIAPAPGGQVSLTFTVPANRDCALIFAPQITDVVWSTVTNFPAVPNDRVIEMLAPAGGSRGFYRLRTP